MTLRSRSIPHLFAALLSLAACNDDTAMSGTSADASTTGGISVSATSADPPTGEPTSGASASGTGEPVPEVTRVVYSRYDALYRITALRGVEIVDGAPQPPQTLLSAPPDGSLQAMIDTLDLPRWLPYTVSGPAPSHFWLVESTTFAIHELPVPPGSAFGPARLNARGTAVILPAAEGAQQAPFMVCTIAEDGACPLHELDPSLPPDVVLDDVRELSVSRGWVVYTTRPALGDGFDVHLAALDSLDLPLLIASFPTASALRTALAPDDGTIYFDVTGPQSLEHVAVDLGADGPGPPVALHPPLIGPELAYTWAPDMSALLLFSGADEFGDLHLVEIDGASAGPMQLIHADAPGHAYHSPRAIAHVSADGARILYISDHETPGTTQLYLVDRAAPGKPPKRLNGPLTPGERVRSGAFLRDPDHVVYFAHTPTEPAQARLVRATVEGPTNNQTLSPPLFDAMIDSVKESADGSRLVYSAHSVDIGWGLHYVDLTDPELVSNNLGDLVPIPNPLWSDFSASGRQFFVSLGQPDAQAQNPLGVAMIPLDPLADAVLLSDPDERGFFVSVAPPN